MTSLACLALLKGMQQRNGLQLRSKMSLVSSSMRKATRVFQVAAQSLGVQLRRGGSYNDGSCEFATCQVLWLQREDGMQL